MPCITYFAAGRRSSKISASIGLWFPGPIEAEVLVIIPASAQGPRWKVAGCGVNSDRVLSSLAFLRVV